MGLSKILGYELRRIVLHRKCLYMTLVALLMAVYSITMSSMGISGTAPFSAPSVAMRVALMSPVWACIAILLLRDCFSERELAARRILFSAPRGTAAYFLPKVAAAAIFVLLLVAGGAVIFLITYRTTFGEWAVTEVFSSLALITLPSLLLAFGLSLALGRLHGNALYALFLAVIFLGLFNLRRPLITDWFGNILYINSDYLMSLRTYAGEGLLAVLPADFLLGRVLLSALGVALGALAMGKPLR